MTRSPFLLDADWCIVIRCCARLRVSRYNSTADPLSPTSRFSCLYNHDVALRQGTLPNNTAIEIDHTTADVFLT